MNSEYPSPNIFTCPNCGSILAKMLKNYTLPSGVEVIWPVSSSGTAVPNIYPDYETFKCTNPECGHNLLRPLKPYNP